MPQPQLGQNDSWELSLHMVFKEDMDELKGYILANGLGSHSEGNNTQGLSSSGPSTLKVM